jgi:hypothetical protein
VLDVSKEDIGMLTDIFNTFSDTDLGKIMIKKKLGKNFADMRKI